MAPSPLPKLCWWVVMDLFVALALGVVVVIIILASKCRDCKSHYTPPEKFQSEEGLEENPGIGTQASNALSVGYFQNMPPSLRVENDYHGCMVHECKGNYFDYPCKQKCYLKAMKNGTTDRADLLCYNHRHSQEDYYSCLDAVYGRYMYEDRSIGTAEPCWCGQHREASQGIKRPDGSCLCPPATPLKDRRLRDQNWVPVGVPPTDAHWGS